MSYNTLSAKYGNENLDYTEFSKFQYQIPPKCSVNMGLYRPPEATGYWAGICQTPDADNFMYNIEHDQSQIPEIYLHQPATHRPGNNFTALPGITKYSTKNGYRNNVNLIEEKNIDYSTVAKNVKNKFINIDVDKQTENAIKNKNNPNWNTHIRDWKDCPVCRKFRLCCPSADCNQPSTCGCEKLDNTSMSSSDIPDPAGSYVYRNLSTKMSNF